MPSFDFDRDLSWVDLRTSNRIATASLTVRELNQNPAPRTNGMLNERLGTVVDPTSVENSRFGAIRSIPSLRQTSVGVNMFGPGEVWPDWTVYTVSCSASSTHEDVRPSLFVQFIGSSTITNDATGSVGANTVYLADTSTQSLNFPPQQFAFPATHDDDTDRNVYALVFGIVFKNYNSAQVNTHLFHRLSVQRLVVPPPPVATAVR